MKSLGKALIVGMMVMAATAQARVESVIEIPVEAGQVELTAVSKLSGGAYLRLKPAAAQNVSLKCHQGFGNVSMMLMLRGSMMSQQVSGAVESMESCVQTLEKIGVEFQQGAKALRVELNSDHTLSVSAR